MLLLTRRLTTFGLFMIFAGLMGVSTSFAQVPPESAPWTTVGSAGTVDESDLLNVDLGAPVAGAVAIRFAGTVRIRYNVVAVDGVLGGSAQTLTARYQTRPAPLQNQNSFFFSPFFGPVAPAQVIVRFMQYNLNTGILTNLATLDSNNFPQTDGFQVQSVGTLCSPPTTLDFVNNSYFMDVSLIKPSSGPLGDISIFGSRPALAMIKLVNFTDCIF